MTYYNPSTTGDQARILVHGVTDFIDSVTQPFIEFMSTPMPKVGSIIIIGVGLLVFVVMVFGKK